MNRRVVAFSAAIAGGLVLLGSLSYAAAGGFSAKDGAVDDGRDVASKAYSAPDESVMIDKILDARTDPAPFWGPDGEVVYVSKDDLRLVLEAEARGDEPVMAPARSADGELRGYFATDLGVIPVEVAEDPAFDLAAAKAKKRAEARTFVPSKAADD